MLDGVELGGLLAVLARVVHGTEDHPDVATTYAGVTQAVPELRTAQRIRENVFGTRDHYMYAETEPALAMLLSQHGRPMRPVTSSAMPWPCCSMALNHGCGSTHRAT